MIPLAILQNTSLCRRLSARYSQVLDPEIVKIHTDQQNATAGDRPSIRRSASDQSVTDRANRRRSASATRGASGSSPTSTNKHSPQTPRRSTSNDQYRQNNYGFGHTYLPPIPASPYQTEESSPPSPKSKTSARARELREKGKVNEKEGGKRVPLGREKEQDKDKVQLETPISPERPSASVSQGKAVKVAPHLKTPPQSLTAAAELFAHEITPPRRERDSTSSPQTPVTPVSDTHSGVMNFSPQAMSSPRSAQQSLKVDVNLNGGSRKSISLLPTPTSPISPGSSVSHDEPSFLSMSKGKSIEKLYGNLGLPPALRNIGTSGTEHNHKSIPPPPLPAPRKSFSANRQATIRTEDIGMPTFDNRV